LDDAARAARGGLASVHPGHTPSHAARAGGWGVSTLTDGTIGKGVLMSPNRRNILIVDDIDINRAILYELFHDQYTVLEAENGKVALDLISAYGASIAVVLLDIVMPVMDGFEVLKDMIETKAIEKTPVIMITAESDEEKALMGYSMGVVDIINKPFNPDIVRRRVQNTIDLYLHKFYLEDMVERQMEALELQNEKLKMSNTFIIDALSTAVEFRNQESGQHIRRIRALTKILLETLAAASEKYRLPAEEIETIASASAMHDIGKIAIADAVLLKPGRLTPDEFEIMKTHTTKGCAILKSINFTGDLDYYKYCYEICRGHHERWDGRGYPDGLAGDEIPVWAQVVSLADVYDALTSDRVYKPAFSHEKAVGMIMGGECGVFNPELLCTFEKTAAEFLDSEMIQKYSEPAATKAYLMNLGSIGIAEDEILSGRTLELLWREREKLRSLEELSEDIVFDYDAQSDTMRFSGRFAEVFSTQAEIAGFRRILRDSSWISQEGKDLIAGEAAKLGRETPRCVFPLDARTASGATGHFIAHVCALFDSDESDEVAGYIGKLVAAG
jgi:putative two-component system response regulator